MRAFGRICILLLLVSCVVTVVAAADEPAKPRKIRGWGEVLDPDGDCKITTSKGKLTIEIPGSVHGLGVERGETNSPRVWNNVTGNFRAQVKVSADFPQAAESLLASRKPFHGAGLVAYADDDNNVRLERAELVLDGKNVSYTSFEMRSNGNWTRGGRADEHPLRSDLPTWLRLERRGGLLRGAVSQDGEKWIELDPIKTPIGKNLKVGVISGHDTSSEFKVTFEDFELSQSE
jgi:regulation of enolase protein 1 (concanavalin A-like superfamily)